VIRTHQARGKSMFCHRKKKDRKRKTFPDFSKLEDQMVDFFLTDDLAKNTSANIDLNF